MSRNSSKRIEKIQCIYFVTMHYFEYTKYSKRFCTFLIYLPWTIDESAPCWSISDSKQHNVKDTMSKNINFFILLRGSMYPEFQCIVICQKRLVLFNQQPITLTLLRSKISFLFTMILNLYSRVTTLLFIFLYIYRMCFHFFSLFRLLTEMLCLKKQM